jgi:hypothetical protein
VLRALDRTGKCVQFRMASGVLRNNLLPIYLWEVGRRSRSANGLHFQQERVGGSVRTRVRTRRHGMHMEHTRQPSRRHPDTAETSTVRH